MRSRSGSGNKASVLDVLWAGCSSVLFAFLVLGPVGIAVVVGSFYSSWGAYLLIAGVGWALLVMVWLNGRRLQSTPTEQIIRLSERLKKSPNDSKLLRQRAKAYFQRAVLVGDSDDYVNALEDIQEILAQNPTYYEEHQLLIECYLWMGKHAKAKAANTHTLALQPITASTLDDYYHNLFDIYCNEEKEGDLIPILQEGLEVYPQLKAVVLHWLAITYEYMDQATEALSYFEQYQAAGGVLTREERKILKALKSK